MAYDLEEQKNHGTDIFPFECYGAHTADDRFLVTYHWHRQAEIICVEQGEVMLTVDGVTFTGTPGDIFFVNPGQLHQLALEISDSSYTSFVFSLDWLDFRQADYIQTSILNPLKKDIGFPTLVSASCSCHKLLRRDLLSIKQMYIMQPDCYRLMIKILLYKIILLLETNQLFVPISTVKTMNHSLAAGRLRELMEFITSHYQEKITLEQAAGIMHMSPKYFSSYFTKTCLISFTQYVNHYRIDQASILLKTTDLPISEIAFETGFENLSYFIRKFKEIRGCTPKYYRAQAAPVQGITAHAMEPENTDNQFQQLASVLEAL